MQGMGAAAALTSNMRTGSDSPSLHVQLDALLTMLHINQIPTLGFFESGTSYTRHLHMPGKFVVTTQ
jgi:hypothetical protein